jgi:GNAT superfamily N-acetyltransferase
MADPVGEVSIRPYEAGDREAVREICYVTGYMGDPIDWQWRDKQSFADLFSSYYTDAEPQSALVAELDSVVAGYLLGCVDSRRAWPSAGIFFRHFLRRGIAFRPGTAGVVWRSLGDATIDALRRQLPPVSIRDPRWPAHLHIDLLASIRGRGVGARLVKRWLESLKDGGVPGCHVETLGENRRALAFFESMGFRRSGRPTRAPGLRSPSGEGHTVQLLVQEF